jgi:type VI secretion system secreted protein Hcp
MTHHHAGLPPSGFAPAEILIPVYLHVQSRRAGKIKGEAKAPGHVDEIEVTGWRWGAQAGGAMNGTASIGRSPCTYQALTIYKRFDTATTALMWALARNDELREVRLTVRRPVSSDGIQEDVFTITLSDARVVALDHEVAADGSSREGVTIESKVVQTQYQSGKPRTPVIAHRLPAPQPAPKAIAPALGVGAPGGQVASNADIAPVWSFRDASMAQRKLDDAKALAEYQARLASQPMQYVGPIDDAGNARAALAQQRTANNLAAALGGPFVAAPMLAARAAGLDESQVEQAGMLGLAALDAAGVKGGVSATRLGSRPRGLVGLTPAEQATDLHRLAVGAERSVTPTLQTIAQANGGRMAGLEFRLKTVESLARKIEAQPERPINDALRYTMTFEETGFTPSVQGAMESLDQQGYTLVKVWNQFKDGVSYKGINSTYQAPDGLQFEVQFHTPASFEMKQVTNHRLYEQQRLLPKHDPLFDQLNQEMIRNSATVPTPAGASSIRKPR